MVCSVAVPCSETETDLGPLTVFLDERNNLKLGDFGLSKAMQQAAMTQTYVGVSPGRKGPNGAEC